MLLDRHALHRAQNSESFGRIQIRISTSCVVPWQLASRLVQLDHKQQVGFIARITPHCDRNHCREHLRIKACGRTPTFSHVQPSKRCDDQNHHGASTTKFGSKRFTFIKPSLVSKCPQNHACLRKVPLSSEPCESPVSNFVFRKTGQN